MNSDDELLQALYEMRERLVSSVAAHAPRMWTLAEQRCEYSDVLDILAAMEAFARDSHSYFNALVQLVAALKSVSQIHDLPWDAILPPADTIRDLSSPYFAILRGESHVSPKLREATRGLGIWLAYGHGTGGMWHDLGMIDSLLSLPLDKSSSHDAEEDGLLMYEFILSRQGPRLDYLLHVAERAHFLRVTAEESLATGDLHWWQQQFAMYPLGEEQYARTLTAIIQACPAPQAPEAVSFLLWLANDEDVPIAMREAAQRMLMLPEAG